jgi:flagellar FliL protein
MAENDAKKNDAPQAAAPAEKPAGTPPGGGEAKTPAEKTAKAGPSPLMAAALLVGMVIGSASAALVVASLLLRNTPAHTEAEAAESAEKAAHGDKIQKPCEYTIDNPLIVNVYQTQERRYLSVKPVFVLTGAAVMEKVKANQAELQHILIGILKGKTLDQLDDPDAGNVLGREIQETANTKLDLDQGITRVYFTQFVVQ